MHTHNADEGNVIKFKKMRKYKNVKFITTL